MWILCISTLKKLYIYNVYCRQGSGYGVFIDNPERNYEVAKVQSQVEIMKISVEKSWFKKIYIYSLIGQGPYSLQLLNLYLPLVLDRTKLVH